MNILIEQSSTDLTDLTNLAAKALGALRRFKDAAMDVREVLPVSVQTVLDDCLGTAPEHVFSTDALSLHSKLSPGLRAAIDQAGGAPRRQETEDGAAHYVGGTDDGRRIAIAADHLDAFLTLGWLVNDMLAGEAALVWWRTALASARSTEAGSA